MTNRFIAVLLIVIGIIHLLPIVGVAGPNRLKALYAIDFTGSDLEILMRHRAILFGLLGGFFCFAAFKPALQPLAFVFAGVSIISFLILAFLVGDFNPAVRKVVVADLVALACCIIAIVLYMRNA